MNSYASLLLSRLLGLAASAGALALAGRCLGDAELVRFLVALALLHISTQAASLGFPSMALAEQARGRPAALVLAQLAPRIRRRWLLAAGAFATALFLLEGTAAPGLFLLVPLHALLQLQLAASPSLVHGRGRPLAWAEISARLLSLGLAGSLYLAGHGGSGLWAFSFAVGSLLPPLFLAAQMPRELRRALYRRSNPPTPLLRPAALRELVLGEAARSLYLQGPHLLLRGLREPSYPALGSALRLTSISYMAPNVVSTLILGPLGRLPRRQAQSQVLRLLPLLALLGVAGALVLSLGAESWIALFFPNLEQAAETSAALAWLAWTLPAVCLSSLLLPYLLAQQCEARVRSISLLGLGVLGVLLALLGTAAPATAQALLACELSVALGALLSFLQERAGEAAPVGQ
ncbi:MAG: hypothetical protein CSA62_05900 [Planctomycetota bacterium]|nr:MAG: hypothetical protein CSA62_05900 [Planctomycetota bacterium]